MKVSEIFVCITLMWLACCCSAEVQMKDENGKYRHHVPEVRQEFLVIADALRSHQMYPKAEKLLKTLTSKWAKANYNESLDQACERLFFVLLRSGRLSEYQTVMKSCPAEQVRQNFLKIANNRNIVDTIFIYDLLREPWSASGSREDFRKICRMLKEQFSNRSPLKKYAVSPDDCSGLDQRILRLNLARYFSMASQSFSKQQAVRLLESYAIQWRSETGDEVKNNQEACAELTALYLNTNAAEKVDSLVNTCSAKIIRKGQLLWLGGLLHWG